MAGPVIVRRYIDVNQLRTNNEVAGFKFATVDMLYAVLTRIDMFHAPLETITRGWIRTKELKISWD
jgi:hypothetical protein